MKILVILLAFASFFIPTNSFEKGKIKIKLEGIQEYKGIIGIMIFNQGDGFPTDKQKALLHREFIMNGTIPELEIADLPPGRYAISIVHDVNGNKTLDKNMLGIPTEPFGFSGNKSILFGLPKFEEAAFELNALEVESRIELIKLF